MMRGLFLLFTTFCFINCNAQLIEQWAAYPAFRGAATDMVLDDHHNIYITGRKGSGSLSWVYTAKYDSAGTELWWNEYNNPDNPYPMDFGVSIALDSAANVYVAGTVSDSLNIRNILLIKYDNAGNQIGINVFNGTLNLQDEVNDLAITSQGNAYIIGNVNGPAQRDAIVIKYDLQGNIAWLKQINGSANGNDGGRSIALDTDENIIAACSVTDTASVMPILLVKYDPAGTILWERKYFGPYLLGGGALEVITDENSNIYCIGAVGTDFQGTDLLLMKYDSAGNFKWDDLYNGVWDDYDYASGIALDNQLNVYVTGRTYCGPSCSSDYVTIKTDSSGVRQWTQIYHNHWSDIAYDIDVDSSGYVYVTGESDTALSVTNIPGYTTLVYDNSGNLLSSARDTSYGNPSVIIAKGGYAYVTGFNMRNALATHATTIKYRYNELPAKADYLNNKTKFSISPNPSYGRFFCSGDQNFIIASIISSFGKSVSYESSQSWIDLLNNPPGVYFLNVMTENRFLTYKLIKI